MFFLQNAFDPNKIRCGVTDSVFLWNTEKNIYIMDNHRCAAWCWAQHINDQKYSILHIDAHYDFLFPFDDEPSPPITKEMSINEYLNAKTSPSHYWAFRWNNYIGCFINRTNQLNDLLFMTHQRDSSPPRREHQDLKPNDIKNLETLLETKIKFIFNLDLDYFLTFTEKNSSKIFPINYISKMGQIWKKLQQKKRLHVTTIALSPHCCISKKEVEDGKYKKGWENSIKVLKIFCKSAEIDITELLSMLESKEI